MTDKIEKYLESERPFMGGTLYTYLEFRGDTTGMITLVLRDRGVNISACNNFRVAFEGEYDVINPMLGRAEYECLSKILHHHTNLISL